MRKKKLNKAQIGTALKPITAENVSDFFSLFSIPQKAITKLITGKYQTPSEAMGIKNKAGAIATDMILDPINLAGAGAIKATGAYKNAYRYNPWAFKANPEAYYHRSPNLENIVNKETGMLQGFGESEAGKAFTEAALHSGGLNLKKGANSRLYFSKGVPLDSRYNFVRNKTTGKLVPGQKYAGPYMAEVKDVPMGSSTKGRAPGEAPTTIGSYAVSKRPISVDEAKFYKEDWLRGYKEVKPSKKKENGGWLDKYEAPKAQNGIEGTMGGLTDKGFNYNGAWGGTMQMGGSLPGAVGFTYARTGDIPSNGPYAKKTKASAQNGMEMKYYQAGLDFKPKNISQDGSEIPVDPMGYWNPENVGNPVIIPSNEITMEGVDVPLIGISDTGDTQMMYPGEDYTFDGELVTEYPVMQPGGKIVPNPGVAYTKKYPPIYLSNPKDPRIGMYTEKGNQYLYKKPTAKESQLPTIYTENPKDKRIKSYQDSLSLYNKFKDAKSNYINTITSKGFNPSYVEEWTTDGYVDKDVNPKIGAIKYGILQNSGGGFDRDEKGNPRYFNYYPTKSGKELKVYLDTDLGKAISTRYPIYKKPVQPVVYKKSQPKVETKKPEPKKEESVKKTEQPKPIERKQNIYEGSPVYSPGAGIGAGSALVGFANQKGDTTYIKPEDYERFAVPKYGKAFIESKVKKQRNGGVNNADAQPIKKLDQSLNFTNYNKPTKGGWLSKYED